MVIQAHELPSDWKGATHDGSSDNYARAVNAFDACIHERTPLRISGSVTAHSMDFSRDGGASQVKSTVTFIDPKGASALVRTFTHERSARCFRLGLEV